MDSVPSLVVAISSCTGRTSFNVTTDVLAFSTWWVVVLRILFASVPSLVAQVGDIKKQRYSKQDKIQNQVRKGVRLGHVYWRVGLNSFVDVMPVYFQ